VTDVTSSLSSLVENSILGEGGGNALLGHYQLLSS
jgi:hypothetical protein